PAAHAPLDPVAEVLGARRARLARGVGLDVARHALDDGFLGQMADAVLERIWNPAVVPPDLGVPDRADRSFGPAAARELPVQHLLVLREDDVPAGFVEGELAVAPALAEAAGAIAALEDLDAVAVAGEHAGEGEAGDAAAQDGDLHAMGSVGTN